MRRRGEAAIAKITTRAQAETRQQEVRHEDAGADGRRLPEDSAECAGAGLDRRWMGSALRRWCMSRSRTFYVTALLYAAGGSRPSGAGRGTQWWRVKFPAIVMAPGHGASGKASDFAMASTFARNGFAVLSYDPIGQGERLQYPDPKMRGDAAGDPIRGVAGDAAYGRAWRGWSCSPR